jgi:mannose-1-phosphate guanylyltransferase
LRVAVIMSGGRGRRFWPLSRASRAKQLIPVLNGKSLLESTLERVSLLFEPDRMLIVTQDAQADRTSRAVGGYEGVRLLNEPVGKNTAACVAYASYYVREVFGDAVLAFLPADHVIGKVEAFRQVLSAGMEFVEKTGALLTMGIKPDRPATGFGYIKLGQHVEDLRGSRFFRVGEFVEKPSLEKAERYLEAGEYLWNAGMFVFKASAIIDEIEMHLPRMHREFEKCRSAFGTSDEARRLAECYSRVEEISIDYGVMEKTDNACVVPADIGWDDVGSWDSFARYLEKDDAGNSVHGPHVSMETADCIIYTDKQLVATVGLSDVTIVATDDAILVMRRGKGEAVKALTDLIGDRGFTGLL